ncbi:hypothetical protein FACS1894132_09780 [Clostridia bacterium]|nr:hypothetical protein FACS1894132_09780 [Clostridia bacterium]
MVRKNAVNQEEAPVILTKDERILAEEARLWKIFDVIDNNIKNFLAGFIQNAAFIQITIQDLQAAINQEGYYETYQNGENQSGRKPNLHVQMHKDYSKAFEGNIALLIKYVPPTLRKDSKLNALKKK